MQSICEYGVVQLPTSNWNRNVIKGRFLYTQNIWRKAHRCGLKIFCKDNYMYYICQLVRQVTAWPLATQNLIEDTYFNALTDVFATKEMSFNFPIVNFPFTCRKRSRQCTKYWNIYRLRNQILGTSIRISQIMKPQHNRTPTYSQSYWRRAWRYQRGNQNPFIEEQTTQWQKKVQKDKQRSTKHTYKTKDRATRTWTPLKTGGELRCSRVERGEWHVHKRDAIYKTIKNRLQKHQQHFQQEFINELENDDAASHLLHLC